VVGPVTVVSHDSVCVGGPAASGECFVQDRTTRRLHVGECLRRLLAILRQHIERGLCVEDLLVHRPE